MYPQNTMTGGRYGDSLACYPFCPAAIMPFQCRSRVQQLDQYGEGLVSKSSITCCVCRQLLFRHAFFIWAHFFHEGTSISVHFLCLCTQSVQVFFLYTISIWVYLYLLGTQYAFPLYWQPPTRQSLCVGKLYRPHLSPRSCSMQYHR